MWTLELNVPGRRWAWPGWRHRSAALGARPRSWSCTRIAKYSRRMRITQRMDCNGRWNDDVIRTSRRRVACRAARRSGWRERGGTRVRWCCASSWSAKSPGYAATSSTYKSSRVARERVGLSFVMQFIDCTAYVNAPGDLKHSKHADATQCREAERLPRIVLIHQFKCTRQNYLRTYILYLYS